MNEDEFRDAMRSGLGRAILHARDHHVRAFQPVILDACLHCYSADPQSEGTRAPYMLDLVNLTGDSEFYRREVLNALQAGGDDWDAVQRFRFVFYLAMDGDDDARRTMYENFRPGPHMAEETGTDFVRMDGLDGFLFAAEKVGELIIARKHQVDEGHLLSLAIETFGEEQTLLAVRNAAATNPRIEAYRSAAEFNRQQRAARADRSKEIRSLSYAELTVRRSELSNYWLSRWGEHASEDDLDLAARDLLTVGTPEERLAYLCLFSKRPFPLDLDHLFQLTASDDERVAVATTAALANITHPAVRDLAFRLVETGHPGRVAAISMLNLNWKLGDHEVVIRWFENETDRHVRHHLGMGLRTFWERHPSAETEVRMLLTLYEKGPCSTCREFLLSRLIELESVPDSIREECAYDANEDVQKLFAGTSPAH